MTSVPTFRRPSLPRVLPTRTTVSRVQVTTEFLPTLEVEDPELESEGIDTTESTEEGITVKPTPEGKQTADFRNSLIFLKM